MSTYIKFTDEQLSVANSVNLVDFMRHSGGLSVFMFTCKSRGTVLAVPTIAKNLRMSEKTVRRVLNDLREHGLIKSE